MPAWLAREVTRVTTAGPRLRVHPPRSGPAGPGSAAYLATIISRGAAQLTAMSDGRKRALSALAYHVGGLLAWSGQDREHIASQLADVGTAAGLRGADSVRIVRRALANGEARPISPPGHRQHAV